MQWSAKRNIPKEEVMNTTAVEREVSEAKQTLQTVEVSAEDRPKLWRLICEKA
jgi:hypothetical protein